MRYPGLTKLLPAERFDSTSMSNFAGEKDAGGVVAVVVPRTENSWLLGRVGPRAAGVFPQATCVQLVSTLGTTGVEWVSTVSTDLA